MRSLRHQSVGLGLAVALLVAPVVAAPAGADPGDRKAKVDSAIEDLQNDLSGTSAELSGAYEQLASARAQLDVVQAQLATAQQQLADAVARDKALAERLTQAESAVAQAGAELAARDAEAGQAQQSIGRIARQAYRTGGMGELSVVLDSQSPDELASRVVLADAAQRSQGDVLDQLAVEQAEVRAQRLRLRAVEAEVAKLKAEAAANVELRTAAQQAAAAAEAEVQQLEDQAAGAVAVISARQAEEEARLGELEQEAAELGALMQRLADEARAREAAEAAAARSAERASRSGVSARSAPAPADAGGVLARPSGGRISSTYGSRIHPVTGGRKMHNGVDFAPGCGAPIVAAASGTVVRAGYAGGAGNMTVIDHGIVNGRHMSTTYMHQESFAVRSGTVTRGQVIGYVGTTGTSTGCHLHFELAVDGQRVDPLGWL